MVDLLILLVSLICLFITVVATAVQDDADHVPKWLLYPVSVTAGATCLYFLVRSIIGLFWILISHLPALTPLLAKVVFTMLTDPIAAIITIVAILTILGLLEREYLFIYTISERAKFRYRRWRSEQKRRNEYKNLRDDVKAGQGDAFEQKARKLVK